MSQLIRVINLKLVLIGFKPNLPKTTSTKHEILILRTFNHITFLFNNYLEREINSITI